MIVDKCIYLIIMEAFTIANFFLAKSQWDSYVQKVRYWGFALKSRFERKLLVNTELKRIF